MCVHTINKTGLVGGLLLSVFGTSNVANAASVTLDPAAIWGAAITAIPVTPPGTSSVTNRGTFTAVNVASSGVDVRFTITGDPLRTGFPRTFTHGSGTGIQGSSATSSTPTAASALDTQTGGAQAFATRGYKIEFFDTGTTTLRTVSDMTLVIGDADEQERYGSFGATVGLSSSVFTIGSTPSHVSTVNNGVDPVFLSSDGTSVTNGTLGGDVDINVAGNLDTFTFTAEKGTNTNLGVVVGLINFDTDVVPEPSSSLLLTLSAAGFLIRRKR